jgi:hypothetical protein
LSDHCGGWEKPRRGFKVSETSNSGKRDRQIAKKKNLKGRLTVNKKLADMYTRKSGR